MSSPLLISTKMHGGGGGSATLVSDASLLLVCSKYDVHCMASVSFPNISINICVTAQNFSNANREQRVSRVWGLILGLVATIYLLLLGRDGTEITLK